MLRFIGTRKGLHTGKGYNVAFNTRSFPLTKAHGISLSVYDSGKHVETLDYASFEQLKRDWRM